MHVTTHTSPPTLDSEPHANLLSHAGQGYAAHRIGAPVDGVGLVAIELVL